MLACKRRDREKVPAFKRRQELDKGKVKRRYESRVPVT
jgi:hypothetical protein